MPNVYFKDRLGCSHIRCFFSMANAEAYAKRVDGSLKPPRKVRVRKQKVKAEMPDE